MKSYFRFVTPLLIMGSAAAGNAQAAPQKPSTFGQCAICHKVDNSGKHGIGPNLLGAYGAKAGSKVGFNFSPAMKNWGKKLDDAALDAFLANPRKTVPGTKMAYAGMRDAAKRKEIIDWLKTQK